MKKYLLLVLSVVLLCTGCFKRDTMEDITIYTSVYPIEYITSRLYGDNATINSIYPNGIIVDKYTLTEKQLEDYGKSDLFIFNGLSGEKDYIKPMFDTNKHLKIIDATASIEYDNRMEEIWLDPSNFLMIAQNIKLGFDEYITNQYLLNEIDENYKQLKIDVSSLDAKIQTMIEKAGDKRIVVTNNLFKYLEKYNFEVISLDESEVALEKNITTVKNMIKKGELKYIYSIKNENVSDTVNEILEGTDVKILEFHSLANIDDSEKKAKKDYLSIMNENIELLKEQLYD